MRTVQRRGRGTFLWNRSKMAESSKTPSDPPTTKRLDFKKQTLDDAYAVPANLLEIEICDPQTHGLARNRYTDYEVRMKVSADANNLQ